MPRCRHYCYLLYTRINKHMKYLLPTARNTVTGQRIKTQDLTGARFTANQLNLAQDVADQYARKMTERTGDRWIGIVRTVESGINKL